MSCYREGAPLVPPTTTRWTISCTRTVQYVLVANLLLREGIRYFVHNYTVSDHLGRDLVMMWCLTLVYGLAWLSSSAVSFCPFKIRAFHRHKLSIRSTARTSSSRALSNSISDYTAIMIVPTGIGASIGGYAGDALPAARLLSSVVDTLITHPNVLNGAMMYCT